MNEAKMLGLLTPPRPPIKWLIYYGANRQALELPDYHLLILEADNIGTITPEEKGNKKCLAYLNISEVHTSRSFYSQVEGKSWIVGENSTWGGTIQVDPRSQEWQTLLIDTVAPTYFEKGYDGIMFDSVDVGEYLEQTWPDKYAGASHAIAEIIIKLKTKFPNAYICCNNGLQPIIIAKNYIDFYLIESTTSTWVADSDGTFSYKDTPQENKNWMYPKIRQIQQLKLPILACEYGNIRDVERTTRILNETNSKGWYAYVVNRDISLLPTEEEIAVAKSKISFKTSKAGSGVNFFENSGAVCPASSKFCVSINDVKTDQDYLSLNFNANDKVDIELTDNNAYYPRFQPGSWNSAIVKDYIKEILEPFPLMKATSSWEARDFNNCFSFCSSLTTIPEGLFSHNKLATSYYYCFSDCSSLTTLPAKLFENGTDVTTFESCFLNCTSLTTVTSDIFASNTNATTFSNTFRHCTALQSIPADLFVNNILATTFSYCFGECTTLTSVPVGLFDTNTEVTDFSLCFYADTGINSVPERLFDKNLKVTTLENCFAWCNELDRFNLYIGSPDITNVNGFVTDHWNGARTFYIKAETTTQTTFTTASLPKVTLSTY